MRNQEYRDRAVEAFRLANEATNPDKRAKLLEMALAWMRLADQAEKNRQTSCTRPPHHGRSQPMQQQQQRAKDES